jgi:hypothetical protein
MRRVNFRFALATLLSAILLLAGCATIPPPADAVQVPPGIADHRDRFSDIFCAVLQAHGPSLPDYRPCEQALILDESRTSRPVSPVELGPSHLGLVGMLVPGIGYACFAKWMHPHQEARELLQRYGFDLQNIEVEALSGSITNAALIRDALLATPTPAGAPRLVLIGYSKGTPDILEAIDRYPEIRSRIAAVVSIAGAVGGSPLADQAKESTTDLLRHFPGAQCDAGDSDAVASLRPAVRHEWLAQHTLPAEIRYYSVVTLPEQARVSRILQSSYRKLARIDPRNDGQVIYSDQFLPGSSLLGFVNADHWAVVLPIQRSHAVIGGLLVTQNDFPREALLEAIMRFVDEDLWR